MVVRIEIACGFPSELQLVLTSVILLLVCRREKSFTAGLWGTKVPVWKIKKQSNKTTKKGKNWSLNRVVAGHPNEGSLICVLALVFFLVWVQG